MRRVLALAAVIVFVATGCPTPFKIGFPGKLPVKRVFVDNLDGIDPIAIYYPDTDPPMQNLPAVILDTGWNQPRLSYDGYGRELAEWGYVCVIKFVASAGLTGIGDARIQDNVAQNVALLDWLKTQNADPSSYLYNMVDTDNAAIMGHSLGAGVALSTCIVEPRFKATVSLDGNYPGPEFDPRAALPGVNSAILFFYATQGKWCSGERFTSPRLFEYTSPPAAEVSVIGASHLDFMDSIIGLTYLAPIFCPRGSANPQMVRDIAGRYMVAWLNVYLKNEPQYSEYYNGQYSQQDIADGLVTIRYNLGNK